MKNSYCPKPGDAKNASNGDNGASKGGTTREFMSKTNGNTWPRPSAQNNASNGQTDGHNMGAPAQTRGYPNAAPTGKVADPASLSVKVGNCGFCPSSSDAKSASNGQGPNSTGGTSRSFPKKGGKDMMY